MIQGMDAANVKKMLDCQLAFALKDLREVIAIQEATVRGLPEDHARRACPKLGQYHDDLYLVSAEVARRSGPTVRRPGTVSLAVGAA